MDVEENIVQAQSVKYQYLAALVGNKELFYYIYKNTKLNHFLCSKFAYYWIWITRRQISIY